MPPRSRGLGPRGRNAIARAAEIDRGHASMVEVPEAHVIPEEMPASEIEGVPDDWWTFSSSRVSEAAYDPQNQRLYVRFIKPEPGGTPWTYEGVPGNVWRNFRRVQSPGKFVNRVLNQYPYHRGKWF